MAKYYDVVQASSLSALVEEINKRLEQGWELHEGSTLTAAGWSQAMTTNKTPEQVKEAAKPKDLTDAEAHAEFLKQAGSPQNVEAMNQITGPTPVVPGINEPMQIKVVATPLTEIHKALPVPPGEAKEKAATELKVKK